MKIFKRGAMVTTYVVVNDIKPSNCGAFAFFLITKIWKSNMNVANKKPYADKTGFGEGGVAPLSAVPPYIPGTTT